MNLETGAELWTFNSYVGCSHNGCTYCAMYRSPEQRFRAKPWRTIAADIAEASGMVAAGHNIPRVFLCDGDALILSTGKLERIVTELKRQLPTVRRVGIYGDARSILRKPGPHGRRLDFLTQELKREANPLGAKATMVENSQRSVDLKVIIEQIREQVQNIE